jgi:hypothetical protein
LDHAQGVGLHIPRSLEGIRSFIIYDFLIINPKNNIIFQKFQIYRGVWNTTTSAPLVLSDAGSGDE